MGNLIGLNVVYQRPSDSGNVPPVIENAGNLGDGIDLDGSGVRSNSIGFLDRLSYIPTSIGGTITAELTIGDAIGSGPLQTFPKQDVGAARASPVRWPLGTSSRPTAATA